MSQETWSIKCTKFQIKICKHEKTYKATTIIVSDCFGISESFQKRITFQNDILYILHSGATARYLENKYFCKGQIAGVR